VYRERQKQKVCARAVGAFISSAAIEPPRAGVRRTHPSAASSFADATGSGSPAGAVGGAKSDFGTTGSDRSEAMTAKVRGRAAASRARR